MHVHTKKSAFLAVIISDIISLQQVSDSDKPPDQQLVEKVDDIPSCSPMVVPTAVPILSTDTSKNESSSSSSTVDSSSSSASTSVQPSTSTQSTSVPPQTCTQSPPISTSDTLQNCDSALEQPTCTHADLTTDDTVRDNEESNPSNLADNTAIAIIEKATALEKGDTISSGAQESSDLVQSSSQSPPAHLTTTTEVLPGGNPLQASSREESHTAIEAGGHSPTNLATIETQSGSSSGNSPPRQTSLTGQGSGIPVEASSQSCGSVSADVSIPVGQVVESVPQSEGMSQPDKSVSDQQLVPIT